ncbi:MULTISPECIES: competence/damage-inducible protein A [unclassified Archaeoglobus]|jgi:molybdenum cofactor synthesis domain-containing protein|uniref:competence/damage-inducible protein A n=1 Tax=unclassified Archaeoglobus TaxID=2643606 RepID=UPI0025BF3413|nr:MULTISPECIES: competence/damage-inducible protein A [unclassified Archaeoglobus]
MEFIIISVGNEILSGDINNTNATYMAKKLTKLGHRVRKIITVPDDVNVIAEEVRKASEEADFVLVTGGLGATHDDVTAEGIARAFGRELVVNKEVYEWLSKLSRNEEAVKKISSVPEGSEIIWNDVGAAPAFIVENVAVMPGVPAEMENTFGKILERFERASYYEDTVRVEGFEVKIVDKLNKVVEQFPDVQIGSYPKSGYVLVKFSGSDDRRVKEAIKKFEELVNAKR